MVLIWLDIRSGVIICTSMHPEGTIARYDSPAISQVKAGSRSTSVRHYGPHNGDFLETHVALVERHGAMHLCQCVLKPDLFVRNNYRFTLLRRIAVLRQSHPCR